jgi:hypothetical protein
MGDGIGPCLRVGLGGWSDGRGRCGWSGIDQPCARDEEGVRPTNDNAVLHNRQDPVCAGAEGDEAS